MAVLLTLEELQQEVEADMRINRLDIGSEITHTLELQSKWLGYHNTYKNVMIKAERRLNELMRDAILFYGGKGQRDGKLFKTILGNQKERDAYIETDPAVAEYNEKYSQAKECLFIVEYVLDALKYRNKTLELYHAVRVYELGD